MKARKAVLPKLWSVLKSGGSGCATMIFPNLLPFLSKVPSEVCIYTLNTYFAAIIITWYFTVLFFFFKNVLEKRRDKQKQPQNSEKIICHFPIQVNLLVGSFNIPISCLSLFPNPKNFFMTQLESRWMLG